MLCLFLIFNIKINPVSAIAMIMDEASTRLQTVDKNLTSSMLSLAMTQVNDSQFSAPDESLDRKMALGTINDLIAGLSVSGDSSKVKLCPDPTGCMIGDLNRASNALKLNHPKTAQEILLNLLSRMT